MNDDLQFYHAVFEKLPDNKYLVVKDIFDHICEGAIVSGTMLNFYFNCYPSAKIKIIKDE